MRLGSGLGSGDVFKMAGAFLSTAASADINIRDCIPNNRFLDFFDGLTTSNRVRSDSYENRSLLQRF